MRAPVLAALCAIITAVVAITSNSEAPASEPAAFSHPQLEKKDRVYLSAKEASLLAAEHGHAIRSMLKVERPLRHGDFKWSDASAGDGPVWVRVDLSRQLISVFRAGDEIGTAVIAYGVEDKPTPRGKYPIMAKLKEHRSSLYDADMPYTLRLTGDGVAIHGSDVRWGAATHGCIGVPLEFAALLFDEVTVGDEVVII